MVTSGGERNGVISGKQHLRGFWATYNILFLCVGADEHGFMHYIKYNYKKHN